MEGGKMLLKDIEDGKKLNELFKNLSEENKNQVLVYLSALIDKQMKERESR